MTRTPETLFVSDPWRLRLGRYGVDNIAIICNRSGYEIARSPEFRCPVADHDRSEAWDSLLLMSKAPALYRALSDTLKALREVRPDHGACAEAQAVLSSVSTTDEEVELRDGRDVHDELADRKAIAAVWDCSDVLSVRPDLTDEQAWEVLRAVESFHDADVGISWEVLKVHADRLFGDEPEPAVATANRIETNHAEDPHG